MIRRQSSADHVLTSKTPVFRFYTSLTMRILRGNLCTDLHLPDANLILAMNYSHKNIIRFGQACGEPDRQFRECNVDHGLILV